MIALLAAAALAARLGAESALPYDHYEDGRPRRVVAFFPDDDQANGEVRLMRLPDSDHGKPRVLDHEKCETTHVFLEFVRLIDERDLVINMGIGHGYAVADRVRDDHFVRLWEGEVSYAPDLDGDGLPEIVGVHYIGGGCGGLMSIRIGRWDGRRYREDRRNYVAYAWIGHAYNVRLDASKHYVVHRYGHARVLLDGNPFAPGKPFGGSDCHTFEVKGPEGAWAFLEERP